MFERHSEKDSSRKVHLPGQPRASSRSSSRTTQSGSLSSRFSQVHQNKPSRGVGKKGGQSRAASGRSRRALEKVSNSMDIDQGNRSSSPPRQRGRGRGRGGRTGANISPRRGRGRGRGGKARGGSSRKPTPTQESLDMELDNYMIKDTKTGTSVLDADLEGYMLKK